MDELNLNVRHELYKKPNCQIGWDVIFHTQPIFERKEYIKKHKKMTHRYHDPRAMSGNMGWIKTIIEMRRLLINSGIYYGEKPWVYCCI